MLVASIPSGRDECAQLEVINTVMKQSRNADMEYKAGLWTGYDLKY